MAIDSKELREYEVWSEGYLCSGMEGIPATAQFHGKSRATSFKEACDKWAETLTPDSKSCYDRDRLSFWGCRLYDNETDARKFLG